MYALIAVIVLFICLWFFRPEPWTYAEHIANLSKKLPAGRLQRLGDFVEDTPAPQRDLHFWGVLHGLRGLARLLVDLTYLVRILQTAVEAGFVSKDDAHAVWVSARKQVIYTLLAIPETACCWVFRELPHSAALQAVHFHWRASVSLNTLVGTQPH